MATKTPEEARTRINPNVSSAVPKEVKLTSVRELKRQQKLDNANNLANFVRTESLVSPSLAKKIKSGPQPIRNCLSPRSLTPATLPTGFVGGKSVNFPKNMTFSANQNIDEITSQLQSRALMGQGGNKQHSETHQSTQVLIPATQVSPKQFILDSKTGKLLSPVTHGLLHNIVKPAMIKNPPKPTQTAVNQQQFISLQDFLQKSSQMRNTEAASPTLTLPQNFLLSLSQTPNPSEQMQMFQEVSHQNPGNLINDGTADDDEHDDDLSRSDTVIITGQNNDSENAPDLEENSHGITLEQAEVKLLSRDHIDSSKAIGEKSNGSLIDDVTQYSFEASEAVAKPSHENCCSICSVKIDLLVTKSVSNNQILKEILETIKNQGNHVHQEKEEEEEEEDIEISLDLPLKSYDELVALSEKLESSKQLKKSLMTYIMNNKNSDYKKMVRSIMGDLITDEATQTYVWCQPKQSNKGIKKNPSENGNPSATVVEEKALKPTCSKLFIMKFITMAIQKSFPTQTPSRAEIKKVLKDWVTRPSDRLRSRAKKAAAAKKAANENEQDKKKDEDSSEGDLSGLDDEA